MFFQLIKDLRITDYDIKLNDVIQLLIKADNAEEKIEKENKSSNLNEIKVSEEMFESKCYYYKKGDQIDVIDHDIGAWFEAKILNIFTTRDGEVEDENDLIFKVKMDR